MTKGVLKAETLLKIVLTPLDPAEALVKNFLILSSDGDLESKDEKTGLTPQKVTELKENFVRILDLKVFIESYRCRIFEIGCSQSRPKQSG